MAFEVRRGDDDSANPESLAFTASVEDLTAETLKFRVKFENPEMVSIGTTNDILVSTVVDE